MGTEKGKTNIYIYLDFVTAWRNGGKNAVLIHDLHKVRPSRSHGDKCISDGFDFLRFTEVPHILARVLIF